MARYSRRNLDAQGILKCSNSSGGLVLPKSVETDDQLGILMMVEGRSLKSLPKLTRV